MKMQLTKGPTLTPYLIPIPDQFGQLQIVGFSGMSELDYVATHTMAAMLQSGDYSGLSEEATIDCAIRMSQRLLYKTNEINQRANQPEPAQQASPLIIE